MDIETPETPELWFDVGFKRYTTEEGFESLAYKLWFDVGFKRYTTAAYILKV